MNQLHAFRKPIHQLIENKRRAAERTQEREVRRADDAARGQARRGAPTTRLSLSEGAAIERLRGAEQQDLGALPWEQGARGRADERKTGDRKTGDRKTGERKTGDQRRPARDDAPERGLKGHTGYNAADGQAGRAPRERSAGDAPPVAGRMTPGDNTTGSGPTRTNVPGYHSAAQKPPRTSRAPAPASEEEAQPGASESLQGGPGFNTTGQDSSRTSRAPAPVASAAPSAPEAAPVQEEEEPVFQPGGLAGFNTAAPASGRASR